MISAQCSQPFLLVHTAHRERIGNSHTASGLLYVATQVESTNFGIDIDSTASNIGLICRECCTE